MASPTRVGTDAASYFASSNPWNLSMTVPSTGQNRALIVMVTVDNAGGVIPTSVKWNTNETMTLIVSLAAVQQAIGLMYYLANPTAATTNVTINWAAANHGSVIAATYQDMVQASGTVVDVSGQANSVGSTSQSKSITTVVNNDIVITWCGAGSGGTWATAVAANSPQALIATSLEQSPMSFFASDTPQVTAGPISTGFTWTGSCGNDLYATSLKYVAPTGGATVLNPTLPTMMAG